MADQRTIDSQAADVFNPRNITGTEPEHPSRKLRCVVVTPEKALLDEYCDLVVLPMFDGEHGVLPNHSPFVGQLGPGELRITVAGKVRRAPRWVQRIGMEWAWRLGTDPVRLGPRYARNAAFLLRMAFGDLGRGPGPEADPETRTSPGAVESDPGPGLAPSSPPSIPRP